MKLKLYSIKSCNSRKDVCVDLTKEDLERFLDNNRYFQVGNTHVFQSDLFDSKYPKRIYICEQHQRKYS